MGCPLARLIGEVGCGHEIAGGDRRPAPCREHGHPTVVVADRRVLRRGLRPGIRGQTRTSRSRRDAPARPTSAVPRMVGPSLRTTASANSCSAVASSSRRARSAPRRISHSGMWFTRSRLSSIARGAPRTLRRRPPGRRGPRRRPPAFRGCRTRGTARRVRRTPAAEARADASAPSRSPIGARCPAVKKSCTANPHRSSSAVSTLVRLGQHDRASRQDRHCG